MVTVVGQELQVGKRLVRVGEGRSSPRAMIRAIATASTASDLPCDPLRRRSLNSERGGHLPYLLAGRGKRPAEPGAIGSRPFHPDGSGLAIVPRPLEQCAMTSWIVRELFDPKDPAELVHRRRGEGALVRVHSDRRPITPSFPVTAYDVGRRRTCGRRVRPSLLSSHFRRPGPAGETVNIEVSATVLAATRFRRVIPGRLPG